MSGVAAISVVGLTHRHRGAATPTLDDVSFDVPAGAIATVVGESGAGKTTLLRCLAGLDRGERGTIRVGDVCVEAGAPRSNGLRGRVGMVFQTFELFPHLTVLENCVLAPVTVRGVSRARADQDARRWLVELGLGDKAAAYPSQLSGGQCQRAAIARALAMAPVCLLYDEPTSALDPARRGEVAEVLGAVRTAGMTQIVVTHDATFVGSVADLVFTLRGGKIERTR